MDLSPHVDVIRAQFAAIGAVGGTETAALVDRLADALDHAARLAMQNAVVAAAEEITDQLSPGSVDVRLRGKDLAFGVTLPVFDSPDARMASSWQGRGGEASDLTADTGTARISFRPPETLKARIEEAAQRAGLSVNAFLVATLTAVLTAPGASPDRVAEDGRSAAGWFQ